VYSGIKSKLSSKDACYQCNSEFLAFHLLSKSVVDKMILATVLYERGTRSLALREEHRLRAFQNRVLSRIFGPNMDKMTGRWRKLHNEELQNLYKVDPLDARKGA
jgi:hypothetical protein